MLIRSERFVFRDAKCLGRDCFRPEVREIPAGKVTYGINLRKKPRIAGVCAHCKDFGCPVAESYTQERQQERINDGWLSVRI